MINKIVYTSLMPVNYKAESIKNKQAEYTKPKYNSENKDVDTLTLSNFVMAANYAKKDNLEIKPLSMILSSADDINKIGGEKVYTSDGKLHSIIKRDEKTVTVLTPDKTDENKISLIEVFDKSNRLIKTQENINDEKEVIILREFDAETGKELRYTQYIDSELNNTLTTKYEKDGKTKYAEYYYADKSYYISVDSPNDKSHTSITMNKNKQIKEISSDIEKGNISNSSCVYFYNGTPYQIVKEQSINIPNTINIDLSDDKELKPTEYYTRPKNLKDIEGEKTYYSNGDVETNRFDSKEGKITAHFIPGGACDKLSFANKEIIFDKDMQTIRESIGNTIKTTEYKNTILKSVEFEDNKTFKEIHYFDNQKPIAYKEGLIRDNIKDDTKCLYFNSDGTVNWVYEK